MTPSEFEIPENLRKALAGEMEGMSFSAATWGLRFPFVPDLADLSKEAKLVGVDREQPTLGLLRRGRRLVAIKALRTTSEIVEELAQLPELRMAFLAEPERAGNLTQLARCPRLEHLTLYHGLGLTSLDILAKLESLRSLTLIHCPRLDLSTLPHLPALREFVMHGGFQEGMKLPSLSPLVRLPGLQRLELLNISTRDGSLAPLAKLQGLKALFLAGSAFEVEEYARLAASLPDVRAVRADCLNPIFTQPEYETNGSARHACPKCQKPRVLLTGKRTRVSCLVCDATRIQKHGARWEAAKQPFP